MRKPPAEGRAEVVFFGMRIWARGTLGCPVSTPWVSYARWIGSGRPQLTQSKPRPPPPQGAPMHVMLTRSARQESAEDADMQLVERFAVAPAPPPRRGSPWPWGLGAWGRDRMSDEPTSSETFEFEMTTLLLAVASHP